MLMLFACQTPKESREELSLAGCWELRLDSTDVTEQVQLPGTTDTNQKGYPNNDKEETSVAFGAEFEAWYNRRTGYSAGSFPGTGFTNRPGI